MFKILFEEYKKHKTLILCYVCLCIFCSVFFGPFINQTFLVTHATETATTLTESETLSTLTDKILGNSISSIAGGYASVVAISCEPFTALLFLGIVENVNRWCGFPLDMISTPAGNPIVLLVIAIFWAASKIMKSNETTQIFGMITLGELEKYLGLVFILVLGILNVTGISTGVMNAVIEAAGPDAVATGGGQAAWVTGLSLAWSVILAIVSVGVYFIIKTVMSGLDVIQVSLSFIPGSALFFETAKSLFAIFLVFVNVICPPLGIALNIIIFIIGCILFRSCYRATRYFEKIYVKPVLKRIRGFDPQISLVSKKLPKRIIKYCKTQNMDIDMALPIFPLKYIGEEKVHKFERWYMIVHQDGTDFMRKRMGKKRVRKLHWENTCEQPVYFRKGLWYFEVFSFLPDAQNLAKRRPKKEFSFVLSMEYFYRHEEILRMTGFENYNVIREAQKLTKKQEREERRMRRKEALLMKLDNIKVRTGIEQQDKQE